MENDSGKAVWLTGTENRGNYPKQGLGTIVSAKLLEQQQLMREPVLCVFM